MTRMVPEHRANGKRPAVARVVYGGLMAALLASGIGGCMYGEPTAGGSSEVDNPVVLTLVDGEGNRIHVSGSLGLYLTNQSPALNPSPRIEIRLEQTDSVVLLPKMLAATQLADSAHAFNLFLRSDDSSGSFLQNLTYHPQTRRFSYGGMETTSALNLTVSPLTRSESVLHGADTSGISRVIIPGSPFKTVLVDSVFVFDAIPPGIYPVHMLTPAGAELPLTEPVNTSSPQNHHFNPDATPVERPHQPHPPDFSINAGPDRTLIIGTGTMLTSEILGVRQDDKRLSVLWRQLPAAHPSGYAFIETPTRLNSRVFFPRTGAYTFIVTAMLGTQQKSDTITIGVQPSPENPVFIEPGVGDTIRWHHWSRIVWMGTRHESLSIELSRDSGATWYALPGLTATASWPGFNDRFWYPVPAPSATQIDTNSFLRLTRNGEVLTQSPRFSIRGY